MFREDAVRPRSRPSRASLQKTLTLIKSVQQTRKTQFSGSAFLLQLLETDSLGTGKTISGLQPRYVTVEERSGVCSVRWPVVGLLDLHLQKENDHLL